MITWKFDKEKGILIVKYIGKITINEILDYIISVADDKTIPRDLKIIEYTDNIEYDFDVDDISKITNELQKQIEKFERIKMCIIHIKPIPTAYSMIYIRDTTIKNYTIKQFSSEKAAMKWLIR